MDLYLIAEFAKEGVNVNLHGPGFLTWPLKLHEKRPATWDEKATVGKSGSPLDLEVLNSQLMQDPFTGRSFDFRFQH